MARIRSVHPGLFTDEAFVSLSDAAQVFFIGLWTEADDQGLFEWKPLTLRMRLRPARDGSVDDLLAELEAANCVARLTVCGRQLGAIRNFRRFQRPKKPNAIHVLPDEFRTYVGLNEAEYGTGSELPPQMEDGGEDVEEEKEQPPEPGASREAYSRDFDELWATYKPIAAKNATKVDASRAFERLSAPDRLACLAGLRSYVEWLIAERRKRPDTPAKHLATFINKRGWEPFAEQQALDATAPKQEWITVDNPRWQPLAEQWKRSHGGRDPPNVGGQGGTGWYFPVEPAPLSG